MAIKVDANKVPLMSGIAPFQDGDADWSRLPLFLFGVQAGFLKPQEVLVAGRVCKGWNQSSRLPSIWKRALQGEFQGLTREQFVEFSKKENRTNFDFELRTLSPGNEKTFSVTNTFGISNCFLAVAPEKALCDVYDENGRLICSPDLQSISLNEGQILAHKGTRCQLGYLTEEELLLSIQTGPPFILADTFAVGDHTMCVFSRHDGKYLRQFLIPREYELVQVDAVRKELVFKKGLSGPDFSFHVWDFNGRALWQDEVTCSSTPPKFCKKRRSFFYESGSDRIEEYPLFGRREQKLALSDEDRFTHFESNEEILCLDYYKTGKIKVWDTPSMQLLSEISSPIYGYRSTFDVSIAEGRRVALVQDKVYVRTDTKPHLSLLYDKRGNMLFSYTHAGIDRLNLFSLYGNRFLSYLDSHHNQFEMRDFQCKVVSSFSIDAMKYPQIKRINLGKIAISSNFNNSNEITILDFCTTVTPPPIPSSIPPATLMGQVVGMLCEFFSRCFSCIVETFSSGLSWLFGSKA